MTLCVSNEALSYFHTFERNHPNTGIVDGAWTVFSNMIPVGTVLGIVPGYYETEEPRDAFSAFKVFSKVHGTQFFVTCPKSEIKSTSARGLFKGLYAPYAKYSDDANAHVYEYSTNLVLPILAIRASRNIFKGEVISVDSYEATKTNKTLKTRDEAAMRKKIIATNVGMDIGRETLRMFQINGNVVIRHIGGNRGDGVFATKNIARDGFIGFYPGEVHHPNEGDLIRDRYVMTSTSKWVYDAGMTDRYEKYDMFAAHLCNEPSVGQVQNAAFVTEAFSDLPLREIVVVKATRPIKKGEEVLVYYGNTYDRDYEPGTFQEDEDAPIELDY